ncbi:MAG: DUF1428 domain-containing protein [Pseudomonadota bacterium]
MSRYVDGFVLPVPKANIKEYQRLAKAMGKIFVEHGALEVVETLEDDVKPGQWTSFPQSVKLQEDEVVVFSWITYKSRAQRDKANRKVMTDPRVLKMMEMKNHPFDPKRMIYGGFKTIVHI